MGEDNLYTLSTRLGDRGVCGRMIKVVDFKPFAPLLRWPLLLEIMHGTAPDIFLHQ
jgi:hypothetical protein